MLVERIIVGLYGGLHGEAALPIISDTGVNAAEPGWHAVSGASGLFVRVHLAKDGSLTRSWSVRVKRRNFGLGSYPAVGLALARLLAQDAHRDAAEGKELGVRAKRRSRLLRTRARSRSSRRSTVPPSLVTRTLKATRSANAPFAFTSLHCMRATLGRSLQSMSPTFCES